MSRSIVHNWIKTACGRAKYEELASRSGLPARLRLIIFIFLAAIRDLNLPNPDQLKESDS